jgi:hypothetical protein
MRLTVLLLNRLAPNADGIFDVRAHSGAVRIVSDLDSVERFSVEWSHSSQFPTVKHVLQDGTPYGSFASTSAKVGPSWTAALMNFPVYVTRACL